MLFREGSWDQGIWNSVYVGNEYGIVQDFEGDVLDIGAHIGSFTKFILGKGARRVHSVEPDPDNYRVLKSNLETEIKEGSVKVYNNSIGLRGERSRLHHNTWPNTGGGYYEPSPEGSIESITMDYLISLCEGPILLKLDCEGCEYCALSHYTEKLDRIGAIVGEFHRRGEKGPETLGTFLRSQGYLFSFHNTGNGTGLFGAHRPN